MKVAAIDVGTNTALLTIADGDRAIEERSEIVRLGEGLDKSGRLKDEAIARTVAAVEEFARAIARHGCDRVAAVTTEAVRKAANGGDFVARASAALAPVGGRMEVIDGEREARLSWRAVASSFPSLRGPRTVVDIGGGSTELIVGERDVEDVVSVPIGSVRLTERCLLHDPPTAAERAQLERTIADAFAKAPKPRGTVVGIAGTVTTLSAIAQELRSYDATLVHGSKLTSAKLHELTERLAAMPLDERRRVPGLDPKRADVIVAGAFILASVMAAAGADACLVSDRGIRWGLVYELVEA
ncbi:MAG TPA: Ppx/GppA phosphatase family protein [Polyangia bacterium]